MTRSDITFGTLLVLGELHRPGRVRSSQKGPSFSWQAMVGSAECSLRFTRRRPVDDSPVEEHTTL